MYEYVDTHLRKSIQKMLISRIQVSYLANISM